MAEAEDKAAAPAKARSGLVGAAINAVGIFVLAFGAVIAGGFVNELLHPRQVFAVAADGRLTLKPSAAKGGKDGEPATPKPAIYFAFDPPLIVNFDDAQAVRFLQLQIEVLAREQKAIDDVKLHSPVIRNNLLMLMNGRDYQSLMSREGKEKLRQECLKEIQRILTKETGKPGIEDVFFTSFVVQ